MASPSIPTKRELIARLRALTADAAPDSILQRFPDRSAQPVVLRDADALVTHIEVNNQHGVGVLARRFFAGYSNILSIRSADFHNGEQDFGDLHFRLSHPDKSRDAVFLNTLHALGENTVARVLCIPYFPDDVRNALALTEIFGAPMCTYLMDDQNICADGISDDLIRELLAKSTLRLAVSPELYVAYELKYGCRIYYLPPLAPAAYIQGRVHTPALQPQGIIPGNIWGQRWLDLLRETVRNSGVTVHWYSNNHFRWLDCDRDALVKDGIIPCSGLADGPLVEVLRQAPFVILPSGTLDESDDHSFIAQLSLPSRLPYTLATSHAPVIVLGDRRTGAARFVEQYGIGVVAPYEREAFRQAVDHIITPSVNLDMRRNALAVAGRFTDVGAVEWIWRSLARGQPIDQRYEDMMPKERPDLSHLVSH